MALHINMAGVQTDFEPLDFGTYLVRVDSVEEFTSSTGNQCLKWTFECLEEPNEGRKLFLNTSLKANALWKLAQTLVALGWAKEDIDKEDFVFEAEDCLDLEALVVVTQQEYEGTMRNSVERLLPVRESAALGEDVEMDF